MRDPRERYLRSVLGIAVGKFYFGKSSCKLLEDKFPAFSKELVLFTFCLIFFVISSSFDYLVKMELHYNILYYSRQLPLFF